MSLRAVRVPREFPEFSKLAGVMGGAARDIGKVPTCILQTADVRSNEQPGDVTSAVIAKQQSAEVYHCSKEGWSQYVSAPLAEGATLAALFKLGIHDASTAFS